MNEYIDRVIDIVNRTGGEYSNMTKYERVYMIAFSRALIDIFDNFYENEYQILKQWASLDETKIKDEVV